MHVGERFAGDLRVEQAQHGDRVGPDHPGQGPFVRAGLVPEQQAAQSESPIPVADRGGGLPADLIGQLLGAHPVHRLGSRRVRDGQLPVPQGGIRVDAVLPRPGQHRTGPPVGQPDQGHPLGTGEAGQYEHG
jgi:hypothetical protein